MPTISLEPIIGKTLSILPERTQTVLSRRFGLESGEEETLQAIGDDCGLTRERVRQIESEGLRALRQPQVLRELAVFSRPVESHLKSWGGLRREGRLFNELPEELGFKGRHQHFNFLLTVTEPFQRFPETEHHHHLWTVEEQAAHNAKKLLLALYRELAKIKSPQSFDSICSLAADLCRRGKLVKDEKLVPRFSTSAVDAASFISANPFGEYGLNSWERIMPRRTGERAYLVLEKDGKPLHFREIAERVSVTWGKATHKETVHNELIKDPRFVLVGRGIYALKDWGFQAGTVVEVIADLLEAEGRALGRDAILENVLKVRLVKPSTVLLNLSNRKMFLRTPEGKYALKK